MGVDILGGVDPDAMTDEDFLRGVLARAPVDVETVLAAGSHGVDVPVEVGWVRAAMLADGCWNLAPPELLTRLRDHEAAPTQLASRPGARWAGATRSATAAGATNPSPVCTRTTRRCGEHGRAVLHSAHGTLTVTVVVDDSIRPGVVSMTHGRAGHSAGLLISAHADVDPLTAMPHTSGVPVTIEAEVSV